MVLSGLLAFILLFGAVIGAVGLNKLYAKHNIVVTEVTVQGTPEQVARGEHIAQVLCASCHSNNASLPLSGGGNLADETGMPLGDLFAPNITPASDVKDWSDTDLFRILRTGVNDEGRTTFMALVGSRVLSDDDIFALIAYMRQSPAVENETPEFKPSILLAILTGANLFKLEPAPATSTDAPAKAVTLEYGKYVLGFADCGGCHGSNLDGNVPSPQQPTPNLTLVIPQWSKEDFFKAMRTGVMPGGKQLNNDVMPWKPVGGLDDAELEALYLYMHSLLSSPSK